MNLNTPAGNQQPWIEDNKIPARGHMDAVWYAFFMAQRTWLIENSQAVTTATRPITNLYAGRFCFDKSLGANGKPIWVNKDGTGWVLADGTTA